jgi:uncharacterized membrane protein YvlD (DUF360 family)
MITTILFGIIIGALVGALFSGFVIWLVSKMGFGLHVSGFGAAFTAAIVIALLSSIVHALVSQFASMPPGLLGSIINFIISVLVLLTAGRWLKGLMVNGIGGAVIGSAAITVVGWIIRWGLGLLLVGIVLF